MSRFLNWLYWRYEGDEIYLQLPLGFATWLWADWRWKDYWLFRVDRWVIRGTLLSVSIRFGPWVIAWHRPEWMEPKWMRGES